MKLFSIVCRQDETSYALKEQLIIKLTNEGYGYNEEKPEFVFAIGGDGTFLYAVHHYLDQLDSVCFLGIHTGTLGFFCDYKAEELDKCVIDVLTKKPVIEKANLLKITLDDKQTSFYALNEMRVENIVKTQLLDIFINGTRFETFRGTGICLSTQLGSTAYNRSLGGAVIESGLPLLQLTEITGIHHRAFRSLGSSLILRSESQIVMKADSFEGAMLCYDHHCVALHQQTQIFCQQSEKSVQILRYRQMPYLHRLKVLF